MPEPLRDVIEDIQRKLKANAYQNEEHVRLSLVARVVQALGWDIWNPGEVNAEYKATANEDNTKVDLTLLTSPGSAAAFIEIKGVGRLIPNLNLVETQMKGYLRNYSAPFCILTDGQHWYFYFVYASRMEFADKCFKKLNLLVDDLDEIELVFDHYLSKENHLNSHAKVDAEEEMTLTDKERRIRECVNEAESRAKFNRLLSDVAALIAVVRERHKLEINEAEALRAFEDRPLPPPPRQLPVILDSDGPKIKEPIHRQIDPTQTTRRNAGRQNAPVGLEVTNNEFESALIMILRQKSGKGSPSEIENAVYDYPGLNGRLSNQYWRERLNDGIERWRKQVQWAAYRLREGRIMLSVAESGRGIWALR